MNEEHIDVWIIHRECKVLVTDLPGVPTAVTVIINPEDYAKKGPTVSNLGFDQECHKSFTDWFEAREWGNERARELGYEIEYDNWVGREAEADEWDYDFEDTDWLDEYDYTEGDIGQDGEI